MKKNNVVKRLIAATLATSMAVTGAFVPVFAQDQETVNEKENVESMIRLVNVKFTELAHPDVESTFAKIFLDRTSIIENADGSGTIFLTVKDEELTHFSISYIYEGDQQLDYVPELVTVDNHQCIKSLSFRVKDIHSKNIRIIGGTIYNSLQEAAVLSFTDVEEKPNPEVKPDPEEKPNPEVKPDPEEKPDVEIEKPEVKPEAKPETNPEAKPEIEKAPQTGDTTNTGMLTMMVFASAAGLAFLGKKKANELK